MDGIFCLINKYVTKWGFLSYNDEKYEEKIYFVFYLVSFPGGYSTFCCYWYFYFHDNNVLCYSNLFKQVENETYLKVMEIEMKMKASFRWWE